LSLTLINGVFDTKYLEFLFTHVTHQLKEVVIKYHEVAGKVKNNDTSLRPIFLPGASHQLFIKVKSNNMLKKVIKVIQIITFLEIAFVTSITQAVEIYEVRSFNISPLVIVSGTVIPKKEVTLSAQLPGRVELIAGEEGDGFSQGSVLVALDDRELLAQRRAAVANWRNAEATLRNAGVQYSREWWSPDSPEQAPGGMGLPHLFDQFITKPISDLLGRSDEGIDRHAQLHRYRTQIEQARYALSQAKSQIEQIDAKLRDAEGQAPFTGVITRKIVEVGDTVQPGQPLLQFADIDRLQIEVDVPARLRPGLKLGNTVSAKLDVLDERLVVTVAQIFPVADKKRHTVKVKFDLELGNVKNAQYVGPGQYAQVELPDAKAGKQETLLIPLQAVQRRGSLPGVCVRHNEREELRLVRLGKTINPALLKDVNFSGEFITVLSGLNENDQILIPQEIGETVCERKNNNTNHH
jgi:multidrug efflux pump subunit AcrA (membrane-fusion protein)